MSGVVTASAGRAATLEERLAAARRRRDLLHAAEVTGGASYLAGAVCCGVLRLRLLLAGRSSAPRA